jgi:hypothetical protein
LQPDQSVEESLIVGGLPPAMLPPAPLAMPLGRLVLRFSTIPSGRKILSKANGGQGRTIMQRVRSEAGPIEGLPGGGCTAVWREFPTINSG